MLGVRSLDTLTPSARATEDAFVLFANTPLARWFPRVTTAISAPFVSRGPSTMRRTGLPTRQKQQQ